MGDYPRRQTKPLPREKLAPIGPAPREDDAETKVRCRLCMGTGMTSAEIAVAFDDLCKHAREQT